MQISSSTKFLIFFNLKKKKLYILLLASIIEFGAGGGTRTHTPLLTTDFESAPSTNSSTPAYLKLRYYISTIKRKCLVNLNIKLKKFEKLQIRILNISIKQNK